MLDLVPHPMSDGSMIKTSKPPAQSWSALQKGLRSHAKGIAVQRFTLADGIAKSSVLLAHPIYFVKLQHLTSGKGLRYARAVIWRYFLQVAKVRKVGVAEISVTKPAGCVLASFSASEEVKTHYLFLRSMIDDDTRSASYSLRMVRIPSIRILAVWLRSADGRKDILIPLGSATEHLKDGYAYPRKEFEAALEAEACGRSSVLEKSILPKKPTILRK